jgi:glucosamine-6-phosphate deaminase
MPAALPTSANSARRRVPGTRLPCYVFDSNVDLARLVAEKIAAVIRERNAAGQMAVLGLPTGSTPVGVYRELIRMHHEDGLDFSRVITFNLDEYYGLAADQLQSFHRWMHDHFFRHVNIRPENIHLLHGQTPEAEIEEHCRAYEDEIVKAGGIDVHLLGVGRNGHIGFNEPFSPRNGRTRMVTLDVVTRRDAASNFFSEDNVPSHALTMGIGTILSARKIILVALGEHKGRVIRELAEGPVTEKLPASYLQEHADAVVFVDTAAGGELTGIATPWVAGPVEWTETMIKRAVLWLSRTTGKGLLKLNDDDFRDRNLHTLLTSHGPAHKLGHRVFRMMMDTIQYHPAGRDPKRVICFSPHPDDDVISMGGGLIRLVEDGHQVHVAYMTSGNIAVFDHDAEQLADLVAEFNRLFGIDTKKSGEFRKHVAEALKSKKPGEPDVDAVLKLKALIRWSEAKAGAFVCGCKEEHLHFLDLPFYRTGTIAKNSVGPEDVGIIRNLLERVQPHQIYVAGDLSDPHGTHRVCAEAIFQALWQMRDEGKTLPEVMLYRGAWQEWPAHEIEIALPLSPRDLEVKRQAIFRHESQKDDALFPGSDEREFWQRAEDRNRNTAQLYDKLGLPEYYALEGYVRWKGQPL